MARNALSNDHYKQLLEENEVLHRLIKKLNLMIASLKREAEEKAEKPKLSKVK